ncbi:ComEC/Rec2 family competence protein [Runella limosa]|uniref:ComEC/Rec2 family competence protein n=1 Tax=Runella limosa TaxID=370978 RepID=UPI000426B6F7|nr:MBL fold metallo-hydrolase [Runella limosa]
MTVEIKLFQVLNGDCIWVKIYNSVSYPPFNLLIDAGFVSTYQRTLKTAFQAISAKEEVVDLFVVTHTHDDHISGIKPFLKEFGIEKVKQFWFNWSPTPTPMLGTSTEVGIQKAVYVRDYLLDHNKLPVKPIMAIESHEIAPNIKITILSPDRKQYDSFVENWNFEEAKREAVTKSIEISTKQGRDFHFSVEELANKPFQEDTSLENRSSIAFLLEFHDFKAIFTGDCAPSVLENSLLALGYSETNPLKLDFFKVSHHSSKSNTSPSLLKLIDCQHFGISSNSSNRDFFPHKETLSRIIKARNGKTTQFFFNYSDPTIHSIFTKEEQDKYAITCVYPKENQSFIAYNWPK